MSPFWASAEVRRKANNFAFRKGSNDGTCRAERDSESRPVVLKFLRAKRSKKFSNYGTNPSERTSESLLDEHKKSTKTFIN